MPLIPDYNNYPSQYVDPRQALQGDPATPDHPSFYEGWLAQGVNGMFMAMQDESADRYPGLPEYVTWDVYTPIVLLRPTLPGPQRP